MSTQGWTKATSEQRLEDLQWMASTGECATRAAARIGTTFKNLEKWCRRNDLALWHRLLGNEPRDHNARNANLNQWSNRRDGAA